MLHVALILLEMFTSPPVEMLPSFDLARCAWRAEQVVVAEEGESIDGKMTVTRCLKGDLRPGSALQVPELAVFAGREERRVFRFRPGRRVKCVEGRRLLLFLRKGEKGWLGAGHGDDVLISFAWLEPEGPYARSQVINPGPLVVRRQSGSESDLLEKACRILADRRAFETARKVESAEPRRAALRELVLGVDRAFRVEVAEALMAEGEAGRDAILALLGEEPRIELHPILIHVLARNDRATAAKEIERLANLEAWHWESLMEGFHDLEKPAPRDGEAVAHYRRCHALLMQVAELGLDPGSKPVAALMKYWDENEDLDGWLRWSVGYRIETLIRRIREG